MAQAREPFGSISRLALVRGISRLALVRVGALACRHSGTALAGRLRGLLVQLPGLPLQPRARRSDVSDSPAHARHRDKLPLIGGIQARAGDEEPDLAQQPAQSV